MEGFEQNKFLGTEQDALRQEVEEDEWQKEYGEKLPYVIDQMNMLLTNGSRDALMVLKSIFLPGELFEHYKQKDVFAGMYLVMCIWEREDEEGMESTILQQGRTVNELIDYLFQLRMILYRLDFGIGTEIEEEFRLFIQQNHTSMITLETMLTTSVMRPLMLSLKLEALFEKYGLKENEIFMLHMIERHWKGNYRVRRKLNSYGMMSLEQLNDVPKKDLEAIIELSELMWKLLYKETGSDREIAHYLKKHRIEDKWWRFLLGLDGVKEIEYYLLIVNALLEERIFDKSILVMEFIIEKKPEYEPAGQLLEEIKKILKSDNRKSK